MVIEMYSAAVLSAMAPDEIGQSLRTAQLEQAYERALREAERIYAEERARTFRVQILLLEDENNGLQDQLATQDEQIGEWEEKYESLWCDHEELRAEHQNVQMELRARARDIEHCRTEIDALNASNSESSKTLAEKLALTRELSVLKPELEHLRSQSTTQQNILAEKLALQREVNALQVELENEKRAIIRIKSQEKTTSTDESMISQVEEMKKELANQKRDAQKKERETQKKTADLENQKDLLESKLDAFRNKLRATKEQLQEARKQLEEAQAARFAQSAELTKARLAGANPRKRPAARFDPDVTIGTPGEGRNLAKKARTSALPGDKSHFSITPFLNRTMSLAPESPSELEDEHDRADKVMNAQIDAIAAEIPPSSPVPAKGRPNAEASVNNPTSKGKGGKALKETTKSNANKVPQKPRLDKVTEEGEEENKIPEKNPGQPGLAAVAEEPVKKKQKVLGPTRKCIFDDDDEAAPAKAKGILGTGLRGGAAFGRITLTSKGKGKPLAEFSPLKRDRKTIAAGSS